jgi:hypothetical protein
MAGDGRVDLQGGREVIFELLHEDGVAAGATRYVLEHGRRPSSRSGDATKYVGWSTTWATIDVTLRRSRKSLPALLDAHAVGEASVPGHHLLGCSCRACVNREGS